MSRLNCNIQELNNAVVAYNRNVDMRNGLRMGQYLWNNFGVVDSGGWPELFYETDPKKAVWLATVEVLANQPAE